MNSRKVQIDSKLIFHLVSRELMEVNEKKMNKKALQAYSEFVRLLVERATMLAIEVCEENGETEITEKHLLQILPKLLNTH